MSEFIYYLNGNFVAASQASLPMNDLAIVRGYGVFDVLRTYGPVPFGLREHLERLYRSAEQIDLAVPWSMDELERLTFATLERNGHPENVTIRLIVSGGVSANFITPGEQPTLAIMLANVKEYPAHCYSEGMSLISMEMERFMPSVKSLNYITAIRAQKRAAAAGAIEALYRTGDGRVTECTTCNFFIFKGNQLITPEAEALRGITRHFALEIGDDLFEVVKRDISYAELAEADEAFITSTTKDLMPIVKVDEIVIGNGRPGPNTLRLLEAFRAFAYAQRMPI